MLEHKTVSQGLTADYCRGWNDAVDELKMLKLRPAVKRWLVSNHDACALWANMGHVNADGMGPEDYEQFCEIYEIILAMDE